MEENKSATEVAKAYEKGLNEAWELAKRITSPHGYSVEDLSTIFGNNVVSQLLNESPNFLLMKEREYQTYISPLDVGDIVIKRCTSSKGIILKIDNKYGEYKDIKYTVVFSNGYLEQLCRSEILPTGNSVDIEAIFKDLLS